MPDPQITAPEQATVRPVAVACCDLDVAVVKGGLPMPPGHAVGHEGVAEIVAIGDAVRDVDTEPQRLAMAEKLGATVHDRPTPDKSWHPYPITVHTTGFTRR